MPSGSVVLSASNVLRSDGDSGPGAGLRVMAQLWVSPVMFTLVKDGAELRWPISETDYVLRRYGTSYADMIKLATSIHNNPRWTAHNLPATAALTAPTPTQSSFLLPSHLRRCLEAQQKFQQRPSLTDDDDLNAPLRHTRSLAKTLARSAKIPPLVPHLPAQSPTASNSTLVTSPTADDLNPALPPESPRTKADHFLKKRTRTSTPEPPDANTKAKRPRTNSSYP